MRLFFRRPRGRLVAQAGRLCHEWRSRVADLYRWALRWLDVRLRSARIAWRRLPSQRRQLLAALIALGLFTLVFGAVGIWSLRGRERMGGPRGPRDVEVVLDQTTLQIWVPRGGELHLAAQLWANRITISRDRSIIRLEGIPDVVVYREDKRFLLGSADGATYDQQTKELRVQGNVQTRSADNGIRLVSEQLNYFGRSELILVPRAVTMYLKKAVMKTSTLSIDVRRQLLTVPRKLTFQSEGQGTLVADSAQGDLHEQRVSLLGQVVMNVRVRDIKEQLASVPGEHPRAPEPSELDKIRVRLRTSRADYYNETNRVWCPEPVVIVTENASATARSASLTPETISLIGQAVATVRLKDSAGPLTLKTERVDYALARDEVICPGRVHISLQEGWFEANSARADATGGKFSVAGNVRGGFFL